MKMVIRFEDDNGLFIQRLISLLHKRQYSIENMNYCFSSKLIDMNLKVSGVLPFNNLVQQVRNLNDVISVKTF